MPPSKVRLSCSLGARPLRAMLFVAHRAAMLDSYSPPAQNGPSLPHRHHFRVLKVCQLAPAPSCSDSAADLPSAGQAASQPYWSQGTQRRPVTVAARVTHTVHNVQTRTAHLQARPCAAQTARPWGSWSCSPARAWRCRRPRWSRGTSGRAWRPRSTRSARAWSAGCWTPRCSAAWCCCCFGAARSRPRRRWETACVACLSICDGPPVLL